MEFVFIGVVALVLYAGVSQLHDDGRKQAERLGFRANRRD